MTPSAVRLRRRFVLQALSGVVAFPISEFFALAQRAPQAALPDGIGIKPDYTGPLPNARALGKNPATRVEVETARAIIAKAPEATIPFEVARFFLAVGAGTYGDEWKPYISGWPIRWNPVIVEFFDSTRTKPSGDVTPWCAAFANWCFQRVRLKPATQSASSGSFRDFGVAIGEPRLGDYVVFESTDPDRARVGCGHVGFFVEQDETRVLVLGGNQIRQGNHMINQKWIPKKGDLLRLHSFRTHSGLHNPI